LKQVNSSPEEELLRLGYQIRSQALGVPGALVRARVLPWKGLVLLDPEGVADLSRRLECRGLAGQARERILAHELFHVLAPACPESLAELAAHLFAGGLLNLQDFPGAIDLPDPAWEARPAEAWFLCQPSIWARTSACRAAESNSGRQEKTSTCKTC